MTTIVAGFDRGIAFIASDQNIVSDWRVTRSSIPKIVKVSDDVLVGVAGRNDTAHYILDLLGGDDTPFDRAFNDPSSLLIASKDLLNSIKEEGYDCKDTQILMVVDEYIVYIHNMDIDITKCGPIDNSSVVWCIGIVVCADVVYSTVEYMDQDPETDPYETVYNRCFCMFHILKKQSGGVISRTFDFITR